MTGPTPGTGDPMPDHPVAGHLIALGLLPGIGPATLLACHRLDGAVAAWASVVAGHPERSPSLAPLLGHLGAAGRAHLTAAARALDPAAELRRHRHHGCQVLVLGEPGYPDRLADDPAPPAVLFATGDAAALRRPTVAIVGTRNATRPGRDLARQLGEELAAAGASVVSGLALGIDGAAHQGALAAIEAAEPADAADGVAAVEAGARPEVPADGAEVAAPRGGGVVGVGRPVGVIASGLDIAYPRRHAELHGRVAAAGLLLSETALGERPIAWRFPARNRIIAGLADAVVVVESRSSGGSMLTVSEALHRGLPVLAVPGHPTAPASAGTNDLLFDGATVVRSTDDVLGVLGLDPPPRPAADAHHGPPLAAGQRAVLAALGDTPASLPELVARSGRPLEEVAEALVHLEARQLVGRSSGWFERTGPAPRPARRRRS